jgi:hypothetical protein
MAAFPWLWDVLLRSPEADDARIEVCFERFLADWVHGYSQHFEHGEYYDPRDTRKAFLEFCAREFDRQLNDWPWNKKNKR